MITLTNTLQPQPPFDLDFASFTVTTAEPIIHRITPDAAETAITRDTADDQEIITRVRSDDEIIERVLDEF